MAVQVCGRNWKRLQEAVPSKTLTQIKNFYQNYKGKVRWTSESCNASTRFLVSDQCTGADGLILHLQMHTLARASHSQLRCSRSRTIQQHSCACLQLD